MVGVRLRPSDRVRYYDENGIALNVGDTVIVEDDHEERQGTVAIAPSQVLYSDLRGPMLRVLARVPKG
jgi:cell fate regulator YaaT (PSP1 superfamily)